jgi:hypothetical protein
VSRGQFHFTVCVLALWASAASFPAAHADIGRWQIRRGGDGTATASLLSTNTLSTGNRSIEYHPVLTIGCKPGQPSSWTQSVRIREAASGSGTIQVAVRVDGRRSSEAWTLGGRNSSLSRAGGEAVQRLLGARKLNLNWRVGYFSGRGEAVFSIAGIKDAVTQIAAACGIDPP